ncbi:MAG: toll/interleukin-1 receptor domain-containing protein, partial [Candidatus Goldbacteria bacterium]|nr:toll/interleukin-1 receptor domain-containing protein [Candidatus Goldiibacteriota bacterium]
MQSKVFISHSSKDHEFVNKLVERLGKDDIDLFVDDWDIKVGDYIKEKIEKGLEECDFFMFILSKNSLQSKWVEEEIDIATLKMLSGKNIKILPVILDLEINEIPERFRAIRAAIFYHNEIKDDEYLKIIEQIRDSERAKALNKFQESFFSDLEYIDNIIKKSKNVNRTEVEIILNKIKNETYERYFFDHVDSEEWFEILKVNDFFVPDVKKLKPIDKGNGFFSLPYWDVLPYLEKLSKNEEFISKDENTKKLIEIIKNVTKILKDKNIDNSRIWDSFISIIINLPNNTIDFECIRLLEDWINTKFPI